MRGLRLPGGVFPVSSADPAPFAGPLPVFAQVPPGTLPDGSGSRTGGFGLSVVPVTARQYRHYLNDQELPLAPVALDEALALLPATEVTWPDAVAYCEWLGARIATPCQLPSAAEWQYAAAGPFGYRWALGDEFDRKTYAPRTVGPQAVGRTPPNAFGLHDMTGNVFEWCADPLCANGRSLGSRVIKGGAYTVRNPESFANETVFTADELSTLPYIGFRVLSRAHGPS